MVSAVPCILAVGERHTLHVGGWCWVYAVLPIVAIGVREARCTPYVGVWSTGSAVPSLLLLPVGLQ